MTIKTLIKNAKNMDKTIIFPEGESERVQSAALDIIKKKLCKVVLIGDESKINDKLKAKVEIVNPATHPLTEKLAKKLHTLRKAKGIDLEKAKELILHPFYFATMFLHEGHADGMVGGVENSTADFLRPALQIIKTKKDIKIVSSSVMFMGTDKLGFGENNVLFTTDCALNILPDAKNLADIAHATAATARSIAKLEPRVAFLSFSTNGSGGDHPLVQNVKNAVLELKKKKPDYDFDGEMQLDAALIESVAKSKFPNSKVAGKANILVFPSLESGNIGYKLIERFTNLHAIGQIMQGFNKPVNDMSRGCSVADIVNMTAVTLLQSK